MKAFIHSKSKDKLRVKSYFLVSFFSLAIFYRLLWNKDNKNRVITLLNGGWKFIDLILQSILRFVCSDFNINLNIYWLNVVRVSTFALETCPYALKSFGSIFFAIETDQASNWPRIVFKYIIPNSFNSEPDR